jgi:hypothetical protein
MRSAGHEARVVEGRDACRFVVGKPKGMRPLGRPRRRCEDNFKMDLARRGMGHGLNCSGSRKGQAAGFFECGNEPSVSINWKEFHD